MSGLSGWFHVTITLKGNGPPPRGYHNDWFYSLIYPCFTFLNKSKWNQYTQTTNIKRFNTGKFKNTSKIFSILVIWANRRTRWFPARKRFNNISSVWSFPESYMKIIWLRRLIPHESWNEEALHEKEITGVKTTLTVSNFAGSKFRIGGEDPKMLCVNWRAGWETGISESISWIKWWEGPFGFLGPLQSEVRANPTNILLSQGSCNSSIIL